MAISLVQSTHSNTASTTTTSTLTLNGTAAGNLIIVSMGNLSGSAGTVTSVTATGHTFTSVGVSPITAGSVGEGRMYYAKSIPGGNVTITINWAASGQGTQAIYFAREYAGLDTGSPFDKAAGATGSSTAISSGATATTTSPNELVVGFGMSGFGANTYTLGSGFGNLLVDNSLSNLDGAVEDKIVSATGTQTATFAVTGSWNWNGIVATFQATPQKTAGRHGNQTIRPHLFSPGLAR